MKFHYYIIAFLFLVACVNKEEHKAKVAGKYVEYVKMETEPIQETNELKVLETVCDSLMSLEEWRKAK